MTDKDCWIQNRAWHLNLRDLMDGKRPRGWSYYLGLAREEWDATQRSD